MKERLVFFFALVHRLSFLQMPNHVRNLIYCVCRNRDEPVKDEKTSGGHVHVSSTLLMDAVKGLQSSKSSSLFDFERLVPLPPEANSGDHTIVVGGNNDWYTWRIKNWGTKWNAFDVEINTDDDDKDELHIKFDTAWTHPFPIVKALSLKFPTIEFAVAYSDDDLGCNFGYYSIMNGKQNDAIEDKSRLAILICKLIHQKLPEVPSTLVDSTEPVYTHVNLKRKSKKKITVTSTKAKKKMKMTSSS